jgi:hypothetical protein
MEVSKKVDVFIISVFGLLCVTLLILSTFRKETLVHDCSPRKILHVLLDGGHDADLAMDCVCRLLDCADCPQLINVFVLVPLSTSKPTVWDTSLAATCSAFPRYSKFFENNVHIYKMSLKHYGKGGLSIITQTIHSLESILNDDWVVWMPYLSKLELHWDTKLVEDWKVLPERSVLSFPLQQVPSLEKGIEDMLFLKKLERLPFFYTITSSGVSIRVQAKPSVHPSLYLGLGYPLVTKKQHFLFSTEDDFQESYALWKSSVSIYVSKHSLGFTHLNKSSSQTMVQDKEWLQRIGIRDTVTIQGLMGMSSSPLLQEKILKYGSEIKYQSFKESLVMEGFEE